MIEIPALAAIADLVAQEVDFASIGTNDLCAVDRMNPNIGEYYQTFSPALIRVLSLIIAQFDVYHKEISMCGELAGNPKAARSLVGLGLRKFSMNPANLAAVKQALAGFTLQDAKHAAVYAQGLPTEEEVKRFLGRCDEADDSPSAVR